MIWQLTPEYRVKVIPLNFVLERWTESVNPKTKEPTAGWKVIGYYSGLESAIRAIPDDLAQHPEVKDWEGLRERLESLADKLARSVGR